ncbi:MAG: hypothetical protein Q8P15_00830 [Nanoarchaeota archaeon]|nr:hypothetical protein [Nanoarchaeota archaeon]
MEMEQNSFYEERIKKKTLKELIEDSKTGNYFPEVKDIPANLSVIPKREELVSKVYEKGLKTIFGGVGYSIAKSAKYSSLSAKYILESLVILPTRVRKTYNFFRKGGESLDVPFSVLTIFCFLPASNIIFNLSNSNNFGEGYLYASAITNGLSLFYEIGRKINKNKKEK